MPAECRAKVGDGGRRLLWPRVLVSCIAKSESSHCEGHSDGYGHNNVGVVAGEAGRFVK